MTATLNPTSHKTPLTPRRSEEDASRRGLRPAPDAARESRDPRRAAGSGSGVRHHRDGWTWPRGWASERLGEWPGVSGPSL